MGKLGYTSADLTAVDAAIASGVSRVVIGDREVTYRSLAQLLRIRNIIYDDVNGIDTDADTNPNIIKPTFSRGGS